MKFLSKKIWNIFNDDDLNNKDFFFFFKYVLSTYQNIHFNRAILVKWGWPILIVGGYV